ncbi:MAG: siderophore-interacting protein [Actinomycetota bacterium]|nr:siderophore-interacting protein [Actinomycetota bacterium]
MTSLEEAIGMAGKYRRPRRRRMLGLTVQRSERISPHFVSVTVGGDDFRHLEQSGYDQAGRLFFGDDPVVLPPGERWMLHYVRLPAAKRPRVRMYSIRRFRPEINAFDIEIAVHEGAPGPDWALRAQPGDKIGFLDEGYCYGPPPYATWQLLVGDESAVPAVLAILEQSPDELPAEVFLEVPTDDDVRPDVAAPAGSRIHWLPRNDASAKPGTLALRTVREARLRPGPFYTWTAGESALPTGLRRHLVNDRRVPKSDIAFLGYWKVGRASP